MSTTDTAVAEPVANAAPATGAPAATEAPATTPAATTEPKTEADGDSLIGKKSAEAPKAVEKIVPEKYEFELPKGMQMDTDLLEKATPILKELKLDQAEAGKLFGLIVQREQANVDRWNKQVDGWKQTTIKELGESAETDLAKISGFIDRFGGKRADAIRSILNDTGLGSNPDVVHLFREAAKFHSEDSLAMGSNKNKPTDIESAARKMFPNTKY